MRKRKNIFIVLLLVGLLLVSLRVTYLYQKRQERLAQRYHLLCEVLKPGMSREETLAVLEQAGEFVVNGGMDEPGPIIDLYITFTDPVGRETYGAFGLIFNNYQYVGAYTLKSFDVTETICAFNDQIKSATSTVGP
jgi:hypothetical protein